MIFAFFRKEMDELIKSGRIWLLSIVSAGMGILGPLTAKLTPLILKLFAESLENSGMVISETKISALDSWTQFYKNMPLLLIFLVILFGGLFTKEYSEGTLILAITKRISRTQIYFAKLLSLLTVWTACYAVYLCISYGYTVYYWDNSIVSHLLPAVLFPWLFGIYLFCGLVFFSILSDSSAGVIIGTGVIGFGPSLLAAIPALENWMPTHMNDGMSMLIGKNVPGDYLKAGLVTGIVTVAMIIGGNVLFQKKQL